MKTLVLAAFSAWSIVSIATAIDPSSVSKTVLAVPGSTFERAGVPADYSPGGKNLIFTNLGTHLDGGPIGFQGVQTEADGRIRYSGLLDRYEVVLGNNPTQSKRVGAILSGYYPALSFSEMLSFDGQQAPGLPVGTVFLPGDILTYDPTGGGTIYGELATHNSSAKNDNGDAYISLMLHGPGIDEWSNGALRPLGNGTALWRYSSGQLQLVVRSGTQALGFPSGTVIAASALQPRIVNASGLCLYQADVRTLADVTSRTPAAYLYNPTSANSELLVYDTMPAPGIANATIAYSRGTKTALLDDGSVIIITYLRGDGVTPLNEDVVLRYAHGSLELLARSGEAVPGRPDLVANAFEFYSDSSAAFDLAPGPQAKLRVRVGDYTTIFEDQLLEVGGTGSPVTSDYYDVRVQAPGFPAGVTLDQPLRNDPQQGRIITGNVSGLTTDYTATGCWFSGADGPKLIAYTGQAVPGMAGATISDILLTKFEAKGPQGRRAIMLVRIQGDSLGDGACAVLIAEDGGQLLLATDTIRSGISPAYFSTYYTNVSTSEDRAALIQLKREMYSSTTGAFIYVNPAGDTYTIAHDDYLFDGLSDAHAAAVLNQVSRTPAYGSYNITNPRSGVVETFGYSGKQLLYFQFPSAAPRELIPLPAPKLSTSPTPTPTATPNLTPKPSPTPNKYQTVFPAHVRPRLTHRRLAIPLRAHNDGGIGVVRATLKGRGMSAIAKSWNAQGAVLFSKAWKVRVRDERKAGSISTAALRKNLRLELHSTDASRNYILRVR